MRIALIYPPPWKIPLADEAPDLRDGPPTGYRVGDLDADFHQTPYGLFSLGAQAIRAGHQVKVLNLSAFPWSRVDEVLRALDADLYGMSCWTANRRGVAMVAKRLKELRPGAPVIIGGPHATPLATEMLTHHPSIDLVCLGESDATLLEIVDRRTRGEPLIGVAGTAYRGASGVELGPKRASIERLDDLASPHDFFDTHILMTSRGCPWQCTFCGADTTWGRGFRGNSADYVLGAIERVLPRLPVKMIQIKDDTFTTNKKRVLELCRGMRARDLRFFWSCDTRVDLLSDELLREMRLAGCQRLSLGVESGSQRILDAIDKKITPAEILESTALAKKYGIRVRYYMMLGNRGETRETFAETLAFLDRARPHEYIFSCLSVYPGTRDFHDAEAAGWLQREQYFTGDFQELKTPFDASEEDTARMNAWFHGHSGLQRVYEPTVDDCATVVSLLPDHHAAHMDLAVARYEAGDFEAAGASARRAMELGYPCPGLGLNLLACVAKATGDLDGMMDRFTEAAKADPQHYVLIQNVQAARAWFRAGGPGKRLPLHLVARADFQLLERTAQPTLPGPLADDFAVWSDVVAKSAAAPAYVKTPEQEGSTHELRTKLKVL
jgi:anaerobic magnesium-protoporphyrin IX monomethyl ester cyclase